MFVEMFARHEQFLLPNAIVEKPFHIKLQRHDVSTSHTEYLCKKKKNIRKNVLRSFCLVFCFPFLSSTPKHNCSEVGGSINMYGTSHVIYSFSNFSTQSKCDHCEHVPVARCCSRIRDKKKCGLFKHHIFQCAFIFRFD